MGVGSARHFGSFRYGVKVTTLHFFSNRRPEDLPRNVENFSLSLTGLWELFEDRNLHFFCFAFHSSSGSTTPGSFSVCDEGDPGLLCDCYDRWVSGLLFFGISKIK